jgi:hypothetical protein
VSEEQEILLPRPVTRHRSENALLNKKIARLVNTEEDGEEKKE